VAELAAAAYLCLLLVTQRVVRPSSVVAAMIVPTSSGSIRKVLSVSSVARAGMLPIVASTVWPIIVPDGMVRVMYGICDPFVLAAQKGETDEPLLFYPIDQLFRDSIDLGFRHLLPSSRMTRIRCGITRMLWQRCVPIMMVHGLHA
jgi:hypothetical protein